MNRKFLFVLLNIFIISSFSFGNTEINVEDKIIELETKLSELAIREQERITSKGKLALEAEKKIVEYKNMEKIIDNRINDIETNLNNVILIKEFKAKLSEYKAIKIDVEREIARQMKIIEEFKLFDLTK